MILLYVRAVYPFPLFVPDIVLCHRQDDLELLFDFELINNISLTTKIYFLNLVKNLFLKFSLFWLNDGH
jgi:hypothetical protein